MRDILDESPAHAKYAHAGTCLESMIELKKRGGRASLRFMGKGQYQVARDDWFDRNGRFGHSQSQRSLGTLLADIAGRETTGNWTDGSEDDIVSPFGYMVAGRNDESVRDRWNWRSRLLPAWQSSGRSLVRPVEKLTVHEVSAGQFFQSQFFRILRQVER